MQTLTLEITHNKAIRALHNLEEKNFIKIINEPALDSPALPGESLSLQEFRNWIAAAENSPAVSLKEAKSEWVRKRKLLQRPAR
jgi:hypothetical protein